jgi:hypothetical protein
LTFFWSGTLWVSNFPSPNISSKIKHDNKTSFKHHQLRGRRAATIRMRIMEIEETPAVGGWHPSQKQPYP